MDCLSIAVSEIRFVKYISTRKTSLTSKRFENPSSTPGFFISGFLFKNYGLRYSSSVDSYSFRISERTDAERRTNFQRPRVLVFQVCTFKYFYINRIGKYKYVYLCWFLSSTKVNEDWRRLIYSISKCEIRIVPVEETTEPNFCAERKKWKKQYIVEKTPNCNGRKTVSRRVFYSSNIDFDERVSSVSPVVLRTCKNILFVFRQNVTVGPYARER